MMLATERCGVVCYVQQLIFCLSMYALTSDQPSSACKQVLEGKHAFEFRVRERPITPEDFILRRVDAKTGKERTTLMAPAPPPTLRFAQSCVRGDDLASAHDGPGPAPATAAAAQASPQPQQQCLVQ